MRICALGLILGFVLMAAAEIVCLLRLAQATLILLSLLMTVPPAMAVHCIDHTFVLIIVAKHLLHDALSWPMVVQLLRLFCAPMACVPHQDQSAVPAQTSLCLAQAIYP